MLSQAADELAKQSEAHVQEQPSGAGGAAPGRAGEDAARPPVVKEAGRPGVARGEEETSTGGGAGGPTLQGQGQAHDYASTMLLLPDPVKSKILALGAKIDDADLAPKGRESNPHVTVLYGLTVDDPQKVAQQVKGQGPLTLGFGALSVFGSAETGGDYEVLKVDVMGASLHELHNKLKALPHEETHPEYQPHATVAYLLPGRAEKYTGASGLAGQRVRVKDLVFAGADGQKTTIVLD
jgi:2'-5' RNA ligase